MNESAAQRLRELNAYRSEGSLSIDAYRKERTALLDDFEIRAANYSATVRPHLSGRTEQEARARARQRRKWGAIAAAALGIVIGLPLLFGLFRSLAPDVTEEVIKQTPNINRPLKLVSRFMARNDWSKASLERFLAAWHELSESERRMIRGGTVFKSLTDSLRQRVRRQRARMKDNTTLLLPLETFAAELGIAIPVTTAQPKPDPVESEDRGQDEERIAMLLAPGQAAVEPEAPGGRASDETAPQEPQTEAERSSDAPTAAALAVVSASKRDQPAMPKLNVERRLVVEAPHPCSGMTAASGTLRCAEELTDDVYGPLMVLVDSPAGAAFLMGQWEVTYREYSIFCRWENRECPRSVWGDDNAPVVLVSWGDAVAYAGWLSWLTGAQYRLPTDDEWEQAVAHVQANTPDLVIGSGRQRTPLTRDTTMQASGIMHLGGNVKEWVARPGEYSVSLATANRTVRGGCYADDLERLSPAMKRSVDGVTADRCTGFRVVRDIQTEHASAAR